jgi:hypothetical protein
MFHLSRRWPSPRIRRQSLHLPRRRKASTDGLFCWFMELQVGYCSVVKYNSRFKSFLPHIFRPTSANHFGGMTALSTNDFQSVNGFSNSFWGWGGEDDQLYQRVKFRMLLGIKYPYSIGGIRGIFEPLF